MTRTYKHTNYKITKNCTCILCDYMKYKTKEKRKHDKIYYDDIIKRDRNVVV